jgi:hypothetical protein
MPSPSRWAVSRNFPPAVGRFHEALPPERVRIRPKSPTRKAQRRMARGDIFGTTEESFKGPRAKLLFLRLHRMVEERNKAGG